MKSKILEESISNKTLGVRVLQGSSLQFIGRVSFRALKFIRTIVVAKILFPHDVGLFALASLCLGFADVFAQTGFQSAIVEKDNLERRHIDGAWTVHVLKGLLLGTIAFLLAPHAAYFFNEPDLTQVLRVLSIILVLDGFVNMGVILLQKDLEFGKKLAYDFSYISAEIVGVLVAVQFFQSVWALVIGAITGQIAALMFSYVFHTYRPHFTIDFSGVRELFRFGKWISITGIITFFVSKGDGMAIGKFIGVEDLGYYQLAFSLALLPSVEIVRSLGSVFFPFFVRLREKKDELRISFIRISRIVLLILFPATIGLYATDTLIILTLYNEKWIPIVPVLNILILYGGLKSIEYLITPVLLGTGNSKTGAYATSIYGIVLLATLVPFTIRYGIEGTAWSFVLAGSISTTYLLLFFYKTISLTLQETISILLVPLCASILMYVGVVFTQEHIISILAISLVVGFVIYTCSIFILDKYMGKHIQVSFSWIYRNLYVHKRD